MGSDRQPLWRQAAVHTLHAALVMKADLEQRLQEATGLVLADNEALLNVGHSDVPLRMSDIAERLVLSPGGATKVIDRLEALGHVVRRPDPSDRRATLIELTESGRHAIAENRRVIDAGLEEIWAVHLTDEEAEVVVAVMDRVGTARQAPGH